MSKWRYNLGFTGKAFKESLESEDETAETVINVYKCTIKCLALLKGRLSKNDINEWLNTIDEMMEDLEMACPEDNMEFDYEEQEESINAYLINFYDLCDNMRVWIGI